MLRVFAGTALRVFAGAVVRVLARGVLRVFAGAVLRVLGPISMATLVVLQFVMPLFVGGGALRLGALRGIAVPRIPIPRITAPRISAPRITAPRARVGRCSFSASTAVVLADGTTRPIADVRVGDRVLAADPVTGERGARNVTQVWMHEDVLVELETSDGAVVSTTEDHPFWNATDQQWQPAMALDPGDRLLTGTDTLLTVDGLDLTTADTGVAYNLTVDDLHTYYVRIGDHTALVHNDLTCFKGLGVKTTTHFRQRLAEDKIKGSHALDAYLKGDLYFDPQSQSYIRHNAKTGITVVSTAPSGGTLKTVWRGKRKQHWQPHPEQPGTAGGAKAAKPRPGTKRRGRG